MLKVLFYIFISLFLVSCAGEQGITVPDNNKVELPKNLPDWFYKSQKNSKKLYGVGIAKSTSKAVNNALIDMISTLSISVDDKMISTSSSTKGSGIVNSNEKYISETILEVKKTFTSEYFIEKMKKVENQKVILLSVSKDDFIKTTLLNIESLKNNLKALNLDEPSKENVLKRAKTLSLAITISKKIDYLNSLLKVLNYKYQKNNLTQIYTTRLKNDLKNLKIYFKSTMNPVTFVDLDKQLTDAIKKEFKPVFVDDIKDTKVILKDFKKINAPSLLISLNTLCLSPDKKYMMIYLPPSVHIYDIQKAKLIKKVKAHKNFIGSIDISSNSKYALSVSRDSMKYWNLKTGKIIKNLKVKHEGSRSYDRRKDKFYKNRKKENEIYEPNFKYVKFYNSRYAVTGSWWGTVKIWDLKKAKDIKTFDLFNLKKRLSNSTVCIDTSNKQNLIAVATNSKRVYLFDFKKKKQIAMKELAQELTSVSISPDSREVVIGLKDGSIAYWDYKIDKLVTRKISNKSILKTKFLKNSKYVYAVSGDSVKIVDIDKLKMNSYSKNIAIDGNFDVSYITDNLLLGLNKNSDALVFYNLKNDKLKREMQLNSKAIANKDSSLVFNFSSCAEAYRAIEDRGFFGGVRGVEIYKGCTKIDIQDFSQDELYTRRLKGEKIKSRDRKASTLAKASIDSYNSEKNQNEIKAMIQELKKHELLKYIMRGN